MKERVKTIANGVYYSLPIQLLGLHLKKNLAMLILWLFLFAIITGQLGKSLGIPYLFLDPEYLDKVNFLSFFIIGISLSAFSISFIISTYINESTRFNFLISYSRPFSRFSINNLFIPLVFLITYSIEIWNFQKEINTEISQILFDLLGLYTGLFSMAILLFSYFRLTNKDVFKYVVCKLDEKIRENVQGARAKSMSRLNTVRKRQIRIDYFLNFKFKPVKVINNDNFYDKQTILQVFDQNQFNLVSVEIFIFITLLIFGLFSENLYFQIPAASSVILLLTVFIMLAGAFVYWFRGWSITLTIIFGILLNFLVQYKIVDRSYQAFGLNYDVPGEKYNLDELNAQVTDSIVRRDIDSTLIILNNWKKKQTSGKPKIVIVNLSGGGQRSMLWTVNAFQTIDSILGKSILNNTILLTGASGGLIGGAYYREIYHRSLRDSLINPLNRRYFFNAGKDKLNPVIFSLLVNDIFLGFQKVHYSDRKYKKDRGFAFEQALNRNTGGIMDVPLSHYKIPERNAEIPMMIMSPTVINDGRKLYIGPHSYSYLCQGNKKIFSEVRGVDFMRFYRDMDPGNIRFLSALRMSATFPYVTPNVSLPSEPPMEIMDAGLTDNFGINDAVNFIFTFKEWLNKNTSGIILLNIRDSQKNAPVNSVEKLSLFYKMFSPIQGLYKNFENIQDYNNDKTIEKAVSWYDGTIHRLSIEYNAANNQELKQRASLNWRLTEFEKRSILENIRSGRNLYMIERLKNILEE